MESKHGLLCYELFRKNKKRRLHKYLKWKLGFPQRFMVSPEYANDAEVLMFLSECWRCQFGAFFASLRLNKHLNLSRMKNFFKTACLTFIICYTPTSNMFIIIYTVCHHLKPVQSISAPNAFLYPLKYTYSTPNNRLFSHGNTKFGTGQDF